MIRVKRRTDYAIRILLTLAKHTGEKRLSGKALQDECNVPQAFFRRIVADLARLGLVETISGPHGGVRLALPLREITLRQIVEGLEGPVALSECLLEHSTCPFGDACPVRPWWQHAQDALLQNLERASLDKLLDGVLPLVEDEA
ncbi:MAG: Rrf2 family transcriptional regulator [Anaerolineae bacterium]|nr:MAG: Rrf2 family transcriptional regulator [Anaerolineae bacterium]